MNGFIIDSNYFVFKIVKDFQIMTSKTMLISRSYRVFYSAQSNYNYTQLFFYVLSDRRSITVYNDVNILLELKII